MSPPATSIGALALRVLTENARAFDEHAPGARQGGDPRHVHQMRVATRRLRAALRLFNDLLPPEATRLNDELNWIAALLGARRDLDVQVARLREAAADLGLSDVLVPYGAWLEEQRQQAQAELTRAMGSPRFAQLAQQLQRLNEWTLLSPHADAAVKKDAPRRLRRTYRQMRKRARRVDEHASAAAVHKVRISAKRLRYAAEFFEPIYAKPARRLSQHLAALQDSLGEMQDGVVGAQHIHQAIQTQAGAWPAETSLALGRVVQHDHELSGQIRAAFPRLYAAIADGAWRRLRRSLT